MNIVTESAPGKLYIAGEYAVVTPGQPAIIAATSQTIKVTIEESSDTGTIHSQLFGGLALAWYRDGRQLKIDDRENPYHFIIQALQTVEEFLSDYSIPVGYYNVRVDSALNDRHGIKYGLGSSGAVTVATIRAALSYYHFKDPSNELVYKLSAITHLRLHSNGSFGDLATSTYGGWILYRSFDKEFVVKALESRASLSDVVNMAWPKLEIKPLEIHESVELLIGWTKKPASTAQQLDLLAAKTKTKSLSDCDFLSESSKAVLGLADALRNANWSIIYQTLRQLRTLLKHYTNQQGLPYETKPLTALIDVALSEKIAAKASGAGGGDCGIALINRHDQLLKETIIAKWLSANIIPLNRDKEVAYVDRV